VWNTPPEARLSAHATSQPWGPRTRSTSVQAIMVAAQHANYGIIARAGLNLGRAALNDLLLRTCPKQRLRTGDTSVLQFGNAQSESESENATEGVIWKARDLWSAPVEWSNHGMQERKFNECMQSLAATIGGHLPSGGCSLCPSGSMSSSKAAPPQSRRVGCHRRVSASVLHAGAGLLRTRTPAATSKCTTPP